MTSFVMISVRRRLLEIHAFTGYHVWMSKQKAVETCKHRHIIWRTGSEANRCTAFHSDGPKAALM